MIRNKRALDFRGEKPCSCTCNDRHGDIYELFQWFRAENLIQCYDKPKHKRVDPTMIPFHFESAEIPIANETSRRGIHRKEVHENHKHDSEQRETHFVLRRPKLLIAHVEKVHTHHDHRRVNTRRRRER